MKRDMELIRKILLNIEGDKHDLRGTYTGDQVGYHLGLLIDGGYITQYFLGKEHPHWVGGFKCDMTYTLTWKGHDFIEATRNESFFKKCLAELKEKAVPVTFGLVLEYIKAKAKEQLGIGNAE